MCSSSAAPTLGGRNLSEADTQECAPPRSPCCGRPLRSQRASVPRPDDPAPSRGATAGAAVPTTAVTVKLVRESVWGPWLSAAPPKWRGGVTMRTQRMQRPSAGLRRPANNDMRQRARGEAIVHACGSTRAAMLPLAVGAAAEREATERLSVGPRARRRGGRWRLPRASGSLAGKRW